MESTNDCEQSMTCFSGTGDKLTISRGKSDE